MLKNEQIVKWVIGALTTLVMFFGGLYVTSVTDSQRQLAEQVINHESRLTTLEENQKNTTSTLDELKQDIKDVKSDVREIRDVVIRSSR